MYAITAHYKIRPQMNDMQCTLRPHPENASVYDSMNAMVEDWDIDDRYVPFGDNGFIWRRTSMGRETLIIRQIFETEEQLQAGCDYWKPYMTII
ncbi:MAG: hypothetical protein AB7D37_05580 [Desulfovibrio sp.]